VVVGGHEVPAGLDAPRGFADRAREGVDAPRDLGVGEERRPLGAEVTGERMVELCWRPYSRLMENPDRAIREKAAADWLAWEDAVISNEDSGHGGSDAMSATTRAAIEEFKNR
jgi:hypothetical protein